MFVVTLGAEAECRAHWVAPIDFPQSQGQPCHIDHKKSHTIYKMQKTPAMGQLQLEVMNGIFGDHQNRF